MYTNIRTFGNSDLRIFCNESYSIELFFILLVNENDKLGVDEIYNKITLPKPKKSSVDTYIKFLIDRGYVKNIQNKDKRKKTLILTDKTLIGYKNIKS